MNALLLAGSYPIWSPYESFDAADILLELSKADGHPASSRSILYTPGNSNLAALISDIEPEDRQDVDT